MPTLCDTCRRSIKWVTKTSTRKEYFLNEADLKDVPQAEMTILGHPVKLYQKDFVEEAF